jgi:hypothetical protein
MAFWSNGISVNKLSAKKSRWNYFSVKYLNQNRRQIGSTMEFDEQNFQFPIISRSL